MHAAQIKRQIPNEEWAARVDLAACYRLAAFYGMTDLIFTHISARVPGKHDEFLINPFGSLFSEVTASSLVRVDLDGNVLDDNRLGINLAGFTIHSAVHGAREDAGCVMHTHTTMGMAVAAQEDGLLPLTQHALRFYNRIGYHEFEGIALNLEERERLVRDLGTHRAMILRNHGLLTVGTTIQDAFSLMHYLERACQAQIAAQSGGGKLHLVGPKVAEHTAWQYEEIRRNYGGNAKGSGEREWPALLRLLDEKLPGYRD